MATVAQMLQSLNTLLASLSSVVANGTKFRGFPLECTDDLLAIVSDQLALAQSYVNTIRNGRHSPICRLPPELVARIFAESVQTMAGPRNPYGPPHHHASKADADATVARWWPVHLSAVCRYWRAVVLLSPSLWRVIVLEKPCHLSSAAYLKMIDLCLARSSGLPLDVHISRPLSAEQTAWVAHTLAAQSARIRTFHVDDYSRRPDLFEHFRSRPGPVLANFTVRCVASTCSLPMVFKDFTPSLRHLELKGIRTWKNHFRDLRTVHFENAGGDKTFVNFLAFLAESPGLEELSLRHVKLRAVEPQPDSLFDPLPVSFPLLSQIEMRDISSGLAADILTSMRPSTSLCCQLTLDRGPGGLPRSEPARLLHALTQMQVFKDVTQVQFDADRQSTWFATLRIVAVGTSSSLHLITDADMLVSLKDDYMAALVGLLAQCRVRELFVKDELLGERQWRQAFSVMPAVTRITIGPWINCPSFLFALHERPSHAAAGGGSHLVPLRSLQHLVIFANSTEYPGVDRFVMHLENLLRERKARGSPLRITIEVLCPSPGDDDFLAFQAHHGIILSRLAALASSLEVKAVKQWPWLT